MEENWNSQQLKSEQALIVQLPFDLLGFEVTSLDFAIVSDRRHSFH